MCTGKEPFHGKTNQKVYEEIKKGDYEAISSERYSP
jgi:hypothetical protein